MKFRVEPRVYFACFAALVALGGCLGIDELDLTDDGGGGMGAVAGSGSAGQGGGGDGGTGDVSCGPVCAIACEFGNVLDAKGCPTCSCNPAPKECGAMECPPIPKTGVVCPDGSVVGMTCKRGSNGQCSLVADECPAACKPLPCRLACQFGLMSDRNGCNICECAPAPTCQRDECELGKKGDGKGCPTCACNPPTVCTDEMCGPAPKAPNHICEDGSTAGPTCELGSDNVCSWRTTSCATACESALDFKTCGLNEKCRWLEPGCSGDKLPRAGCFPRTAIDCVVDSDCAPGKRCVTKTADLCYGLPILCFNCAPSINVCLASPQSASVCDCGLSWGRTSSKSDLITTMKDTCGKKEATISARTLTRRFPSGGDHRSSV